MATTAIDTKASYNHKSSQNYLLEHRKTKATEIKPFFEHKSPQIIHLNIKGHNNRK